MLPSELWPNRKQRLWGSILTVCLSVWTQPASAQGAAAEVTNARVGDTVILTAPVTAIVMTSVWYRGTVVSDPQVICYHSISTSLHFLGSQFTGRETCGPDGSLEIRDLQTIDTGNYTVSVTQSTGLPVTTTRQLWVYGTDLPPTCSPCPSPGSSWQTTLGVAGGVLLVAVVIVVMMRVYYGRCLRQKDTKNDENVSQNPSVTNNNDTRNENMRKGREGHLAALMLWLRGLCAGEETLMRRTRRSPLTSVCRET